MKNHRLISLIIFCFSLQTHYAGDKPPFLAELAVVFKKKVSQKRAETILHSLNFPFHEGGDSSRGKIYFYRTGPKFLMNIPKEEIGRVKAELEAMPEVHEAYFPNWKIQKD